MCCEPSGYDATRSTASALIVASQPSMAMPSTTVDMSLRMTMIATPAAPNTALDIVEGDPA